MLWWVDIQFITLANATMRTMNAPHAPTSALISIRIGRVKKWIITRPTSIARVGGNQPA